MYVTMPELLRFVNICCMKSDQNGQFQLQTHVWGPLLRIVFTFLFLGRSGGWSPDNCLHGLLGGHSRKAIILWEIKVEHGKMQP